MCCVLNRIYKSPRLLSFVYQITYICRQGYLKTCMCCQVLLDHISSCNIMSISHKLVQMIPGVQYKQHWHVWNLSLLLLYTYKVGSRMEHGDVGLRLAESRRGGG